MKLALVVPSISYRSYTGGIETPVVRGLAERLSRIVDLHVFAMHYPDGHAPIVDDRFTLYPATATSDRFSRRMARTTWAIAREHRREPFDLIHALWLHESGTIAVNSGTLLRLPVVATIGGAEVVALPEIDYGALRSARGRLMTANVLQRATFVTGGSQYALRQARRLVLHRDPSRFRRVPLPVDAVTFSRLPRRPFDAAAPKVLHAASLIPVKDQETLLRAFRRVVDVLPGARLTIAGEDPYGLRSSLERLRDDLSLGRAVVFAGPLPHASMAEAYAQADLFVLSSRHETQAMVVLEAAAAGVPTVGTAVGVVPDLSPEAAIAVRSGNPVELAEAVIALLTDPARLARMGVRAQERVRDEYDAPVVVDAFVRLYEDAVGNSRR